MLLVLSGLAFVVFVVLQVRCTQEKATESKEQSHQKPTARFVGMNACKNCHQDIYNSYLKTGKGHSFYKPNPKQVIEQFPSAVITDTSLKLSYYTFWKADKLFQAEYRLREKDTIHFQAHEVDFVIGSGNQTRSYLREENGYYYEMPLTWYVKRQIWDLSPGYKKAINFRFDRPIGDQCMSCHNSGEKFVPNSVNRFTEVGMGITCEKCHGPASLHVENMQSKNSGKSKAIGLVEIGKLPVQAQIDICRQCHLEGTTVTKPGKKFQDFRPGQALSSVCEVFIPIGKNAADFGFASHAERLQLSKCYKTSAGKLNCTSCHNPHEPLSSNPVQFFDSKCISCHENGHQSCTEKESTRKKSQNSCVSCHLARGGTSDIPHVSSTDHFIRIISKEKPKVVASNQKIRLKNFTTGIENPRDLGLAYMNYWETADHDTSYLNQVKTYYQYLDLDYKIKYLYLSGAKETLSNPNTTDPMTLFYAFELAARNQKPEPVLLEKACSLAPYNQDLRLRLADFYDDKGKKAQAKAEYQRILELNPFQARCLTNLGFYAIEENNPQHAVQYLLRAKKSNPNAVLARENLIRAYLMAKNLDLAAEELDQLIQIQPKNEHYKQLLDMVKKEKGG